MKKLYEEHMTNVEFWYARSTDRVVATCVAGVRLRCNYSAAANCHRSGKLQRTD